MHQPRHVRLIGESAFGCHSRQGEVRSRHHPERLLHPQTPNTLAHRLPVEPAVLPRQIHGVNSMRTGNRRETRIRRSEAIQYRLAYSPEPLGRIAGAGFGSAENGNDLVLRLRQINGKQTCEYDTHERTASPGPLLQRLRHVTDNAKLLRRIADPQRMNPARAEVVCMSQTDRLCSHAHGADHSLAASIHRFADTAVSHDRDERFIVAVPGLPYAAGIMSYHHADQPLDFVEVVRSHGRRAPLSINVHRRRRATLRPGIRSGEACLPGYVISCSQYRCMPAAMTSACAAIGTRDAE